MRLRTTYAMVLDAREAVDRADELVEAAGVLLADALVDGLDTDLYVKTYVKAKAQRQLASAVCESTEADWHRDRRGAA